ncbi:MAG: response regulator [Elusimicrobiota bacterium]|nr:response regulator [Elusimicrobiota bacterium]
MAKVLIIDDNSAVRLILSGMLEELGHQVVGEAADAAAALKAYQALKPDLVTLDLSLSASGEADGTTVLDALIKADAKARVIVISGNAQAKLRERLTAAGAKGFVGKPIQEEDLKSAIAGAVA